MFNGFGMNLSSLSLISDAESRCISPENRTGARSGACLSTEGSGAKAASILGVGWKVSPSLPVIPGETVVLADYRGTGAFRRSG